MISEVRVYCEDCGETFWEGNLIDWSLQMAKPRPPAWFLRACNHYDETGHKLKVKYPSKTVPFDLTEDKPVGF